MTLRARALKSAPEVLSLSHPCAGDVRRVMKEDNVLSHLSDVAQDRAASRLGAMTAPASTTSDQLLARIMQSLEDDKAEDIVTIPLKGKSAMADHMVICSGRSSRQVGAIAEKLTDALKQEMGVLSKVEGKEQGDWVLIDAGDVVVHVFRPEVREFYQLEKMWLTPTASSGEASRTI